MGYRDTHAAVFAEGYDGDAAADLLAAFDEDSDLAAAALAEAVGANDALTEQLAAATAASDAEIQRLKARNYELLEAVGQKADDTESSDDQETDIDIETIDGLFETLAEDD